MAKNMGHAKAAWKVATCPRRRERFPAHHKESTCMRKPPSIVLPPPLYRLPGQQERDILEGMLRIRGGRGEGEETSRSRRRKTRKRRDKGQKTIRHTNCDRRVLTAAPGLVCQRKPSAPSLPAHHDPSFPAVCASFVYI